jgi:hypothetical protein
MPLHSEGNGPISSRMQRPSGRSVVAMERPPRLQEAGESSEFRMAERLPRGSGFQTLANR